MLNRNAINSLKETVPAAVEHLKPLAMRRQERLHETSINNL
eukprot:COSAG01_NODE_1441_length_10293_cov_4.232392_4_plen_41_part_00